MFYSQFILAKKGPLATIWIAAHLERRLRKNQIAETDIGDSVDSILYSEVPIALRLSGHLLLGVVRIYSRKVNLLFRDCSEALDKIRQAFQTSAVDLPPGAVVAPYHSITLPESFDFDDLEVHFGREVVAAEAQSRSEFEHHVIARDLITLQDQNEDRPYFLNPDERFADEGNPYGVLDLLVEGKNRRDRSDVYNAAPRSPAGLSVVPEEDVLPPFPLEEDMEFEPTELYKRQDKTLSPKIYVRENMENVVGQSIEPQVDEVPDVEKLRSAYEPKHQDHIFGLEELEVSAKSDEDDGYRSIKKRKGISPILDETPVLRMEPTPLGPAISSPVQGSGSVLKEADILGSILGGRTPKLDIAPTPAVKMRGGRKRRRIFDTALILSSTEMKKQLKNTSDICRVRKKAPSTEYEIWMSGRVDHMEQKFLSPSAPGIPAILKDCYSSVMSRVFKITGRGTRHIKSQSKAAQEKPKVVEVEQPLEPMDADLHVQEPEAEALTTQGQEARFDFQDEAEVNRATRFPDIANVGDGKVTEAIGGIIEPTFEGQTELVPIEESGNAIEEREFVNDVVVDALACPHPNHVEAVAASPHAEGVPGETMGLSFLRDSRETDEPTFGVGSLDEELIGHGIDHSTGWSFRTRAVAQYLKDKFEASEKGGSSNFKESQKLSLERLLKGRKQKEAARMFFETLVLASNGYLELEQDGAYADICLDARPTLLKAVF